MEFEDILAYYSRNEVKEEVAAYCKGRWVALEGRTRAGGRAFLRYTRGGRPLMINEPDEVGSLLKRFRFFKPRVVYASVSCYGSLESRESTDDPANILKSMPVWDIDASLDSWEYALRASEIITERLDREGVSRSVYLKWSGRGIHIHIHEGAFSHDVLKDRNPLDVAFSVVEYILRRTRDQLIRLVERAPQTMERPLRVENKMDIKRVFTSPLSLHRQLDLCCVCFKQDDIHNFSPEWAEVDNFRHDPSWKRYEEGEGDMLAVKALDEIGGYDGWPEMPRRTGRRVSIAPTGRPAEATYKKIGRFQVMGLLQAARYYLIKGDIERAKSFGLNRAIFYAWAKRYSRDRLIRAKRRAGAGAGVQEAGVRAERIGNETAYLSPRGWFMIGGDEQSARDYDRQIAKRIEASAVRYEDAWETAVRYLRGFPKETLLDQQRFYREVYKPVRDRFYSLIMRGSKIMEQRTLNGY